MGEIVVISGWRSNAPQRSIVGFLLCLVSCTLGTVACAQGLRTVPIPVDDSILMMQARTTGLDASQLGLLINDTDPYSVAVGEYYRVRRNIPDSNIVHLRTPVTPVINRTDFAALKATVDSKLPPTVQALAIGWMAPSRVECNSITSAFARGFMANPCDGPAVVVPAFSTCNLGDASPYFKSTSRLPFTDFGMRPAMMLAAASLNEAKALIDRGVASDESRPSGTAYLMNTSQVANSIRATVFPIANLGRTLSPSVDVVKINADWISSRQDVLFYFQALNQVPVLSTNKYPPGAVADNLISRGGMFPNFEPPDLPGSQMDVLQFISAGVTGAFGTVSEPCAILGKFPDPSVLIAHYSKGETLIEAHWKSVQYTFQGVFVGEPLANPWRGIDWATLGVP